MLKNLSKSWQYLIIATAVLLIASMVWLPMVVDRPPRHHMLLTIVLSFIVSLLHGISSQSKMEMISNIFIIGDHDTYPRRTWMAVIGIWVLAVTHIFGGYIMVDVPIALFGIMWSMVLYIVMVASSQHDHNDTIIQTGAWVIGGGSLLVMLPGDSIFTIEMLAIVAGLVYAFTASINVSFGVRADTLLIGITSHIIGAIVITMSYLVSPNLDDTYHLLSHLTALSVVIFILVRMSIYHRRYHG